MQGVGLTLKSQLDQAAAQGAPRQARDDLGGQLYRHCIAALERAVRLTPEKRLEIAEVVYAEARMLGDTPAEADSLLTIWRRARHLMYRENLIGPTAQQVFDALILQGVDDTVARIVAQAHVAN